MSTIAITGAAALAAPALDALPEAARARAARAERVTQLALSAAGPALAMAGLAATAGPPRPRMGIVFGTAFGCFLTNAAYQRRLAAGGTTAASPRLFAATVSNAAAGEVGIAYRLGGPAITLAAGTAAGLVAIGHAVDLLVARQADVLLAGGIDAGGDALERWLGAGGLGGARVVGEGAALVVLERFAAARARGATVLGSVAVGDPSVAGDGPGTVVAGGSAAAGPAQVVAALAGTSPRVLILQRCPSGHAAAIEVELPVT